MLKKLYQKLVQGSASKKEIEKLAKWLSQLDMAKEMEPQELENYRRKSTYEIQQYISPQVKFVKPWYSHGVVKWSAAAVLLIGVGSVWFLQKHIEEPKVELSQAPAAYIEHTTRPGNRKRVTLSDGTLISLSNASQVRYLQDFGSDKREVFLTGQAFFEVAPDSTRPFLVHTDNLSVSVLGTSFDVQSYDEDGHQLVTVATGKVSVQPMGERSDSTVWLLEKGDQISYDLSNGHARVDQVDLSEELAWLDGQLILKDKPLSEIALHLERWYGMEVHIKNTQLKSRKLSLILSKDPLETVLRMLSIAGDFQYKIKNHPIDDPHSKDFKTQKGALYVEIN